MNELERLRRARPADVELTLDREVLLARIIAGTGDPAAGLPTRRRRRRLVIAIAVASAVTVTAGTAFGFGILGWHTDTSIVKSPREWRALYRTATQDLTLPPGETWPYRTLAPHTVTSRLQPAGEAVAIAQVSWECYWTSAIRSDDVREQRRARAALDDIVRHHIVVAPDGSPENVAPPSNVKGPFEIYASDGGIQYVKHMYARAAAGDAALIAQSCRANGPGA